MNKNTFLRFTILFLLVFLFSYSIAYSASSYYVDNRVASSGNGSQGSPWKNLSDINWTIINEASKACTIYVSGGATSQTYNEALTWGASGSGSGSEIIVKRPTSAEWPGHSGTVYFRSTSGDAIKYNGSNTQWTILDGIDFSSSNGSGALICDEANNNTIKNCTTENNAGFAIGVGCSTNVDNTLVSACLIGPNRSAGGGDPMQVGPLTNLTVEKSIIYGGFSASSGQHFDGIQMNGTLNHVTIRYNIFRAANNASLFPESIDGSIGDVKVYGNIFEFTETVNDGRWCWAIFNDKANYSLQIYIYNNIFVNYNQFSASNGAGIYMSGGNASNITVIKNNIFYNSKLVKDSAYRGSWTQDYNIYYNPTGGTIIQWNGRDYTAAQFSSFRSASGQETHGKAQDPLMARVGSTPNSAYDLRPTSSSPTNVAGDSSIGYPYDMGLDICDAKSSWPLSVGTVKRSAWDIGAYLYSSGENPCAPQNLRIIP